MHVVAETFHTIHLRKWEGAQLVNEQAALAKLAGDPDLEGYPALAAFFAALEATAGESDQAAFVDELEVEPVDEDTPQPEREE